MEGQAGEAGRELDAGQAVTADGVHIKLDANIEFPDDLAAARYAGAEGIGLYRSEFLLMGGVRSWGVASADEEEQYDVYRRMLEGMAPPQSAAVAKAAGGLLLYGPATDPGNLEPAVAYLARRLDENAAPEPATAIATTTRTT